MNSGDSTPINNTTIDLISVKHQFALYKGIDLKGVIYGQDATSSCFRLPSSCHINFQKGWRGHLWQERFHSFPMDENHLLATVRYVELNPVKAKICVHPQDWKWSSASAHLAGVDDILVTVKPMLDRINNWQHYLSSNNSNDNDLVALHTRTGRPLGSDGFVKKLENIRGKSLAPKKPGRKPGKDGK